MPLSQSEADALLQMPKEFVDGDPLEFPILSRSGTNGNFGLLTAVNNSSSILNAATGTAPA